MARPPRKKKSTARKEPSAGRAKKSSVDASGRRIAKKIGQETQKKKALRKKTAPKKALGASSGRSTTILQKRGSDRVKAKLRPTGSSRKKAQKKTQKQPVQKRLVQKRPVKKRQFARAGAGITNRSASAVTRPVMARRKKRILSKPRRPRSGPIRHSRKAARFTPFLCQLGGFLLVIAIMGVLTLYHYSQGLPPLHEAGVHRPPVVVILDKAGREISREYGKQGEAVRLQDLPPHVIHAFIAIEDRNFYHHVGINPLAIARAAFANIREGKVTQGGSTITQQLAKNEYLTPDRTLTRKIQELLIALWLETRHSKDEILGYYLDTVYFGAGATGLDAAAERYFRKKPDDLTVGEAAMLAGLLKAPSKYAPTHNVNAARARAKVVLGAMVEAGYLRPAAARKIGESSIATVARTAKSGHYAVDYAMEEYIALFGPPKSDIIIMTTLDLAAQTELEHRAPALLAMDGRVPAAAQMALVAMEDYGAIRVLIGGRNYALSHFNRASKAKRQPGSAFKPFVYLAGIENGYHPEDLVLDQPTSIDAWQPANYKNKYYGTISTEDALAKSLNAATLYIQEDVGRHKVRDVALRAGFSGSFAPGAALGLGVNEVTPLELVKAYGYIANNGRRVDPFLIDMIKSPDGAILFERDILAVKTNQGLNPGSTRTSGPGRNIGSNTGSDTRKSMIALNHMLRRVITHGSGIRAALPPHKAAGKTGTSQDSRDAWFAGHASGLVGVVWIGRDDNKPMSGPKGDVSGSGAPAVIWREMMKISLGTRPPLAIEAYQPAKRLPHFMRPFAALFGRKEAIGPLSRNLGNHRGSEEAVNPDSPALPGSRPALDTHGQFSSPVSSVISAGSHKKTNAGADSLTDLLRDLQQADNPDE